MSVFLAEEELMDVLNTPGETQGKNLNLRGLIMLYQQTTFMLSGFCLTPIFVALANFPLVKSVEVYIPYMFYKNLKTIQAFYVLLIDLRTFSLKILEQTAK